ncbi:MAG: D-alanyl-D-alanine carboxypeptidase/D-alanyl-D-alanine-endopeptidase [Phycisphaerales bacterium]|nr:D-alanyl-D-alanine carboxypeptidase/D-alanyl-D-alanine-endopeptidase [Phycisphaerales bacterium]
MSPPLRRLGITLSLGLLCAASATGQSLQSTISSHAVASGLRSGSFGIAIVDDRGTVLADIDANVPRIPASNQKLLASGTAILALGHDYEFRTQLLHRGGELVLVGDGDPGLADPELLSRMTDAFGQPLTVDGVLDIWADAVQHAGIDHVDRLVIDDRVFDSDFIHPSWPTDQLNQHYCAGSAGLNFHRNMLSLYPAPGSGAQGVLHDVRPAVPFMPIDNRLKTHTKKSAVSAAQNSDGTIVVNGTVSKPLQVPVHVTVRDMPMLTGRMLADRLIRRGIEVDTIERATPTERFADASPIGPDLVTPMATVLERCNVESRNIYADCLLKRAAHEATRRPGSWRDGAGLVRREVHARTGTDVLEVADGSGMSRRNAVSPLVLAKWMASFQRGTPEGDAMLDSMSTPDRGTIDRRFDSLSLAGCTLEGKTGYIRGVSTLSGVVTAPDGRAVSFSVLCNSLGSSTTAAKTLQKNVVQAIARWLSTHAVTPDAARRPAA